MKVFCVYDKNSIGGKSNFYTKGKWYTVIQDTPYHQFYIISDNGSQPAVIKRNFITVEEYRNSKIEEILR